MVPPDLVFWNVVMDTSGSAADYYRDVFARRSEEDLHTLSHIKRTVECILGDADFRRELEQSGGECLSLLRARGIEGIDPRKLFPFDNGTLRLQWSDEELPQYPLAKLWTDYINELRGFRSHMRQHAGTSTKNPRFHAWRQRQIARCDSELGDKNPPSLVHSILTVELTKGCSVGCWFCGLSAEKLRGVFAYTPENAKLWREMLEIGVDLFGSAIQAGTCYWATEPADNPDYLDFLKDYRRITGELPQTTTAAPLRNLDWTRRVIGMQTECLSVPTRFSILSKTVLRRIHEVFSADDLLNVELLHQHQDRVYAKASAGRARGDKRTARPLEQDDAPAGVPQVEHAHQTIACVSGYLVNMVDRSVRLISPCGASSRWPLGYRTHAVGRFANAKEFRSFIEQSIEDCMPEHVPGNERVAFREDLTCAPLPDGFSLTNKTVTHKITGKPFLPRLGALIAEGDRTAGDVIGILLQEGADFLAVGAMIQDFFDAGLLGDEASLCPQEKEKDA